jgi:hypothetical protein
MLRYESPADVPPREPARGLLVLMLLMTLRDGADRLEYRFLPNEMRVRYRIESAWHGLIPPPIALRQSLVAEVRRAALLVPSETDAHDGLEVGLLTFRLLGHDQLYSVRIDPGERGEIVFERFGPVLDSKLAEAAMKDVLRGEDLFEFEFPPEA